MVPIIDYQIKAHKQRVRRHISFLLAVTVSLFSCCGVVWGANGKSVSQLSELVTNGSYLVKSGHTTIAHNTKDLFVPASTLKILTSLTALELLGPGFRFETHFFIDEVQNLYIKGYGDPFLTSEEIQRICSFLKKQGIIRIQAVFLDDSIFFLEGQTPGAGNGLNPYEAPSGGLAVNFNTLAIHKLADGTIQSGEPQTPTLPIMKRLGRDLPIGSQRINIGTATAKNQIPPSLEYAGELFCAKLRQAGIAVKGNFQAKIIPRSLEPFFIHKSSKTLKEVLTECLHFSNNFIANQVFLYCGLRAGRPPATWVKARGFMENYLRQTLELSPGQITVQDGSGLSRKNKISSEALVTILQRFKPYSSLMNGHAGALLKSGTMQDVYCYGGYFTEQETLVPFVILLNQKNNTRDELLRRLHAMYISSQ